jgi:hypothetical protein
MRRQPLIDRLDWLAPAIAASPVLIGMACVAHVHVSSSGPTQAARYLELGSFAATIGLFIAALVAGVFTYHQIRDAKDARVATIYMEINKTYFSDRLRTARIEMLKLEQSCTAQNDVGLAVCVANTLQAWRETNVESATYARFYRCVDMLQFWEDVGVLTNWKFVDGNVVLDMYAGALQFADEFFNIYIERVRKTHQTLYENAVRLFRQAQD